jgi:Ca2+-transporting ATPase
LSESEARLRAERYGPNSLRAPHRVSAWKILIDQFRSVVMLLLLGAAGIALFLGDPVDAAAIVAVLIINAALGFITELKARGAVAALLRLEVPHATVLRDGIAREVAAHVLVPGDVIQVEAGQSVPADSRLLTSTELLANEAPLTGESLPVEKDHVRTLDADTPLAERVNLLYMSTSVVAGSARAVVIATGMSTELGHIGGLVSGIKEERTPLEHRLDALGHRLVWLALAVTAVVVIVGLLRGEPLGEMLETGLALAIASVPEGLPAVSTIALAVGVARMARRKALIRRLPAVESLGSATVICTDKTGTLTAGEMTVTTLWTAGQEYRISGAGYAPEGEITSEGRPVTPSDSAALDIALRIGALNNRASLEPEGAGWRAGGDPTEAALLVAALKGGLDPDVLRTRWAEVAELPFSSERMLMATFHRGPAGDVVYTKGAPARVIERCTRALTPDGPRELDPAQREEALEQNRSMAGRGLRVLALAEGPALAMNEEALNDLTLVGLVGISDPAAAGVRETIDLFAVAGIRTVMITGDQRLTAEAVARELGILHPGEEVVEGRELLTLSLDEMDRRVSKISAFSRVSPEEKLRIIEAFQRRGEVVAMLGDGVNDAAALKKSDIGVAMGIRGTDVAKEAASVILQDDRFQTIGAAVEEGRVIFDNIRKFVFYLFSCNLAEVLVILMAGLMGLPQPLLPLQILWLNLVTDTFPALSLAIEPGQRDVMRRPPRDPDESILSWPFLRAISLFGLLITAATLAAFVWALNRPEADPTHAVTIAFMTLALAQVFHLGNARDLEPVISWRRATSNRWALAAVALTVSLQMLAVYFPPLAELLGVQPLTIKDWLLVVPLALFPAVVGQALALWRSRRKRTA